MEKILIKFKNNMKIDLHKIKDVIRVVKTVYIRLANIN